MIAPFCFRPLAPLIASVIPAPPLTALDILDLVSLLGTLFLLDHVMRRLGYEARARVVGGAVFAVSFPTLYYGAIGFVDPVAILSVTAFMACVLQERPMWLISLLAVLASLVKETNVAFSILPLAYHLARGRRAPADLWPAAVLPVACAAAVLGVHALAPFRDPGFIWTFRLSSIRENLIRPRTYVSLALTALVPALLAILALASGRARRALAASEYYVLILGGALACAMYLYSITSAYTDGRIIWILYPFAIPIGAAWFTARAT